MAPSLLWMILGMSVSAQAAGVDGGAKAPAAAVVMPPKTVAYRAPGGCKVPMQGPARTLSCTGGVKLWRDDVSLQCERMVATFDTKGNITSATCFGAVQIVTATGTASADQARFDGVKNQVELTGNPKAHTRGNALKADRIKLDLATQELLVEGHVEGTVVQEPTPPGGTP